jgi:hypothetical protein
VKFRFSRAEKSSFDKSGVCCMYLLILLMICRESDFDVCLYTVFECEILVYLKVN